METIYADFIYSLRINSSTLNIFTDFAPNFWVVLKVVRTPASGMKGLTYPYPSAPQAMYDLPQGHPA